MEKKLTFKVIEDVASIFSSRVECKSIIDDENGFKLAFYIDDNNHIIEFFFHHTLLYRTIDEGDYLRTLNFLPPPSKRNCL